MRAPAITREMIGDGLIHDYRVNVRDHGAIGDGGDDTIAINNAKEEALISGKALYFPAGIYRTISPIVYPGGSKVTIFGDGVGLTRIYIDTVDLNLFEIGDNAVETNNWHIRDMSLGTAAGVGNAGGSGYVLQLQRTHRGSMENVSIPGCGGGIDIGTAEGGGVKMDFVIGALFKNVHISGYEPDITGARTSPSFSEAGFLFESVLGLGACNAITFIDCVVTHVTHDYLSLTAGAANGVTIIGGNIESHDNSFAIELIGSLNWQIYTWCEHAPIYLEDCTNMLIQTPLLFDELASQTCLQLVNCLNTSIRNIALGGLVLVDSDSEWTTFSDCRFIASDSLRNDSLTTTIESCFITANTEFRNTRTYGIKTRNHQIDDGVGDMETWQVNIAADGPAGWHKAGAPTFAKETTIVHSGNFSCKVTSTAGAQGLIFRIPDAFKDCWISIEGFIFIPTGDSHILISMAGALPGDTSRIQFGHTKNQWVPFSASFFKADGAVDNIFITTYVTGDVFYLDSVKIWAEKNPYGTMIALGDGGSDDTTPNVYNPGGPNKFVILQQNNNIQVTDFEGFTSVFKGLYDGMEITIIDGDGKSVFVDGAPMQLNGGVNYDTDQYDTLTLMYYQGTWHEVGRGDNN